MIAAGAEMKAICHWSMVIAQFSLNEEWQMTKDHRFNSGAGEDSLNVGAAVLSGDLTPSHTIVAALA